MRSCRLLLLCQQEGALRRHHGPDAGRRGADFARLVIGRGDRAARGLSAAAWDSVWTNFVALAGAAPQFLSVLDDLATYLGDIGCSTKRRLTSTGFTGC